MFRQEAIDHQATQWQGRALLLPGVPIWAVGALSIGFLVAFAAFVTEGAYTRRVTVIGEVTTWPRGINVYSGVQGYVVKQFVKEGQWIKKGEAIYQLDVSRTTGSGVVVSDDQRREIERQISRTRRIIDKLQENKKITLQNLADQKSRYLAAYKRSSDILRQAEKGATTMKTNMDAYLAYRAKGFVTNDQVNAQIAGYYQQQNGLLNLSGQNEQNALQVTNLASQIQSKAAEFDNQIYEMQLKEYDYKKELINTDVSGGVIIRALTDGVVDSMSVTLGQMVNPGDSLLQILPKQADDYNLVLWAPNEALPYIALGDKVNVRYEAFPAGKFGQFSATVTQISTLPATGQEMQTYRGAPTDAKKPSTPYYKIIAHPAKTYIAYQHKTIALKNGMQAQCVLFLEKRKIYQWMLSPIYDMRSGALGPVHD